MLPILLTHCHTVQGELQRRVLRRCLLLVLLLDKAACDSDILTDSAPLLFRLSPAKGIKSSAEVMHDGGRNLVSLLVLVTASATFL